MVVGVECRDRKQRGELKGKEFQRLRYFLYTHFRRLSPKKKTSPFKSKKYEHRHLNQGLKFE